jgi:RNA polymerase sigma factor (sigma-70 family)
MKLPTENKKPRSFMNVEETIRAYDRELHGFLLRRLRGHAELSEDVRQEIYLRMLRFTDAAEVREPRAYLYRVARNVLHDRQLLQAREHASLDSEAQELTADETVQIDNARDMERVLSELRPLHRAVLVARTAKGLSYSEIAQELAISVHTVKKYVHLALIEVRLVSLNLGLR